MGGIPMQLLWEAKSPQGASPNKKKRGGAGMRFGYLNLVKVSGTAGIDVCGAYFFEDGTIDIVDARNTHYGYGRVGEDGLIYDLSNRSVFRIA